MFNNDKVTHCWLLEFGRFLNNTCFVIEGSVLINKIWIKRCYDLTFLLLMSEMSVNHKHSAPSLGLGLLGQPNDGWNFGISHLNTACRYDGRLCRSRFVTRFYYHQTTQNLCYCVNIFVVYINQSRNNLFIAFTHQWFQTRTT